MKLETYFIKLSLLLASMGLPTLTAAQYNDGPIDLRLWVAESYVNNPGRDPGNAPAEHRWDWSFQDDLRGPLGSIGGCVEYTSNFYHGGWHDHPDKLIVSYLNAEKTPSSFIWVGNTPNASSYWEEDANGTCHFNRGDESLCMVANIGNPVDIRAAVPHTYGYTTLFSEGNCDIGARLKIFYTVPAPARVTGPTGIIAPGATVHFSVTPPRGSIAGGWESGRDYEFEIEKIPGSGLFKRACSDCPKEADITMPTTPGTYEMRVRTEYISGSPSRGYAQITLVIGSPEGLPAPWSGTMIGEEGTAEYSYHLPTETFTITTNTTNNHSLGSEDNLGFIHRDLCGNGEIILKVESITGSGYGGVVIRKNEEADARFVALFSNRSLQLIWERRTHSGRHKMATKHNRPYHYWMKVKRLGNYFLAYISTDGSSYSFVDWANIGMSECISLGFGAFSSSAEESVVARFRNVSVSGGVSGRPGPIGSNIPAGAESLETEPGLFPNPAISNITIDLGPSFEQPATLRLRNKLGQLLEERRLQTGIQTTGWDISNLNPSLYFMEIHTEGQPIQVLRFVKR